MGDKHEDDKSRDWSADARWSLRCLTLPSPGRDTLAAPSAAALASSAKARYDMAALVGRANGAAACQARHSSCQHSRQEMMEMLRSVDPQ